MVSASTSTGAKILLGRTGGGTTFEALIARLEAAGYTVIERSSSPIGAHGASIDLHGADYVFLVVRDGDDVGAIGPVRPFQRVARDAGVLQGHVGMDRVTLLVEDSVSGLTSDLGVPVMRFSGSAPESAFDKIKSRIDQLAPRPDPGMHSKLSRAEGARAATSMAPLLVLGGVGLLVFVVAIAVALTWPSGGDSADDAAMVELIDVTESLRAGASTTDDGSEAAGDVAAEGTGGEPAPAAPSAGSSGADQLFPANCELNLADGSGIDEEIPCSGAGVLVRQGSDGPWRDDLRLLALSDGVVGEVVYEGSGTTVLGAGVELLDPAAAANGVSSVRLTFSAVGQHVHLRASAGESGRETILTLRLDS